MVINNTIPTLHHYHPCTIVVFKWTELTECENKDTLHLDFQYALSYVILVIQNLHLILYTSNIIGTFHLKSIQKDFEKIL